ncbi:hypothetical protein ABPG77_009141, partial [Micractinium sp. CCAP 211/92]
MELPPAGGALPADAALQQGSGAGAPAGAAGSAAVGDAPGPQLRPAAAQPDGGVGIGTAFAAAAASAQRQRSGSGLGFAPLRTTISLAAGDSLALPSPAEGGPPYTPGAPSSLLVETLLQELRTAAALESAVYLAGGKRASSGDSRHLHTPARRLARTIICLGPQEGLAFGLQAIRAIEATAGAGSGDLHRLTFWWSNVLQLRWMFWALCHGHGDALAGGASSSALDGARRRNSEQQLSPRTSLAAAAARGGQDWMQASPRALVPHLRELESWLFGEMLKHLWWRVLLQSVTTLKLPGRWGRHLGGSAPSAAGTPAVGAYLRAARSAPHLQPSLQRDGSGVEQASPAGLQGTPRSFESPEWEEAVQRWGAGPAGWWRRVLVEPGRPPPAPRQHLSLLHRQLVVALLRRLDTLLFCMTGRSAFDRTADADEVLGLGGAEAAAAGLLEPGLLPFP